MRIYSILLLVAFLAALGHDMIPHHHHDLEEYPLPFQPNKVNHHHSSADLDHKRHENANHHHNGQNEQSRNVPLHHHLSVTGELDYIRIDFNTDVTMAFSILADLSSIRNIKLLPPPETNLVRFSDKPFLITSIFEPGAIGLRAPPSIA
jgi:hypothetical protein